MIVSSLVEWIVFEYLVYFVQMKQTLFLDLDVDTVDKQPEFV